MTTGAAFRPAVLAGRLCLALAALLAPVGATGARASDFSRMFNEFGRAVEQMSRPPPQRERYYNPPPQYYAPPRPPPAYDAPAPSYNRGRASPTSSLTPSELVELQTLLNQIGQRQGYSTGAPDGRLGPSTRSAIRAFQRSEGLPEDGLATPVLLALVRSKAAPPLPAGKVPAPAPDPRLLPPAQAALPPIPQPPPPQPIPAPPDAFAPPSPPPQATADLAPPAGSQPPEKDTRATDAPADPIMRLRQSAQRGNGDAQLQLGVIYYTAEDPKEAAAWFAKAADQGLVDAQFRLAVMALNGEGMPADPIIAAGWFSKAALQGHATAQFNLGTMYARGAGVPVNEAEAAIWFRKAAEQGVREAQYALGYQYYEGRGLTKDQAQAALWFRKAADQKHPAAAAYLAHMSLAGEGIPENHPEAVRWAREAKAQGIDSGDSVIALACGNLKAASALPTAAEWKRQKGWTPDNESVCKDDQISRSPQ